MLTGLMGSGLRLVVALLVTVLFGQWAAIPWGRWAIVLALYGAIEAIFAWMPPHPDVPPTPRFQRYMEDWTALLPTVARVRPARSGRLHPALATAAGDRGSGCGSGGHHAAGRLAVRPGRSA